MSLLARRIGLGLEEAAQNMLIEYSWEGILVLGGIDGVQLYQRDSDSILIPCMAPAAEQQIGMHDAAATSLAAALGSGLSSMMRHCWHLRHANASFQLLPQRSTLIEIH